MGIGEPEPVYDGRLGVREVGEGQREEGKQKTRGWIMVRGPSTMVHGLWSMVHGPYAMDRGPWSRDHGPWTMVHGPCHVSWSMGHGPWTMDHGPWSTLSIDHGHGHFPKFVFP